MEQSKKIIIRKYRVGDAEKIYSLFSKFTVYKRDAEFWVWINRILPPKKSIVIIAEYNNKIIGHYAILPFNINYFGRIMNGGLGIHAFIHPNFSTSVSIFQLTHLAYEQAKNNEIDFIVGFPNKNFRLISEKIDKWDKIDLFNSFEKVNFTKRNFDKHIMIYELNSQNLNYGEIFKLNELIENTTTNNYVFLQKNINYYLIRYILHPQKLYTNLLFFLDKKLVGFVVLKQFNRTILHVVDFILDTNYINYEKLLLFAENYSINLPLIKKISLWPTQKDEQEILKQFGYMPTGFDTYFGLKIINNSLSQEIKSKILERNNWLLFMGDSDVF